MTAGMLVVAALVSLALLLVAGYAHANTVSDAVTQQWVGWLATLATGLLAWWSKHMQRQIEQVEERGIKRSAEDREHAKGIEERLLIRAAEAMSAAADANRQAAAVDRETAQVRREIANAQLEFAKDQSQYVPRSELMVNFDRIHSRLDEMATLLRGDYK